VIDATPITVPGIGWREVGGVNDAGQMVWFDYDRFTGFRESTVYDLTSGARRTIRVPGASIVGTEAEDIDDAGRIAGAYYDLSDGRYHGFLHADGAFTTIDAPGAFWTRIYGLNDGGQMVGLFSTRGSGGDAAFLYDGGTFTTLAVPGALVTLPYAINDAGQVVGRTAFANSRDAAFLYADGVYTTLRVPGSLATYAYGINDAGQIVGSYDNPETGLEAFVATTRLATALEPSTLPLLALGLAGCGVAARRRV
jgi:probable HAF family extracellular repeat protein